MSTVPVPFDSLDTVPEPAFPPVALGGTLYPENATRGMGARHILPTFGANLERWLDCNTGDFYSLYVGNPNTPLISDVVNNAQLPRYSWSTAGTNVPLGEVQMFAHVIRVGNGQQSRSDTVNYLIKTDPPGDYDPIAGNIWHDGLSMSIEGKPQDSVINAGDAATGLWALVEKYRNIRTNDEITISVGGPTVRYIVSPADAAGPGPIRVQIPPGIFPRINQLGSVAINFTVVDVVGNLSGPGGLKALYSEPYFLISELDPNLLSNPVFNADGAETPLVDLDTQSASVFTVLVPTGRTAQPPNPRNRIVVVFAITNADGSTRTVRLPAINDNNRFSETVPVPSDLITSLGGGSFRVSFELQTAAGALLRRSGSYSVQVVGASAASPLVRPLINGLFDNDTLDLNTFAGNGLLAIQSWPSSAPGNRVWFTCSSPGVADLAVLSGVAITANEAQRGLTNIPVLRNWLQQVRTRRITVTGMYTPDGSTDPAMAIPFLSTAYAIRWQLGIIESIPVGSQPHYIAMTRDGRTAYVTNNGSHTVSVIDVIQRQVVRTISGFNQPFRILLSPDETRLYVGNLAQTGGTNDKAVFVVDIANGTINQRFPGFNYIWGLALNPSGTRLHVSDAAGSTLTTLDAVTGARLSSTRINNPYAVEYNPLGTALYVAAPGEVDIVNTADSGGVLSRIPGLASDNSGSNIAFIPNDRPLPRVYVTGTRGVTIINTGTNMPTGLLTDFYHSYGVAMSTRLSECYVTDAGNSFTVINTQTETMVRKHLGFFNPAGVAVTPEGFVALVANQANGTLSFVAV